MSYLTIIANTKLTLTPLFGSLLSEGGPTFMYPLLLMLLVIFFLIITAFTNKGKLAKNIKLIGSISLFALVFGFLGQLIGIMGVLDSIQSLGEFNANPAILAAGIKIGILSPGFGMLVFLIARAGIIALQIKDK